jgi:hypothetical protein
MSGVLRRSIAYDLQSSSPTIAHIPNEGARYHRTNGQDGSQDAEESAPWLVEILIPLFLGQCRLERKDSSEAHMLGLLVAWLTFNQLMSGCGC